MDSLRKRPRSKHAGHNTHRYEAPLPSFEKPPSPVKEKSPIPPPEHMEVEIHQAVVSPMVGTAATTAEPSKEGAEVPRPLTSITTSALDRFCAPFNDAPKWKIPEADRDFWRERAGSSTFSDISMLPNHEMAREWALRSSVHFGVPASTEPDPNRLAQYFFMEAFNFGRPLLSRQLSTRLLLPRSTSMTEYPCPNTNRKTMLKWKSSGVILLGFGRNATS